MSIWSDNMVLLTMGTSEILILVIIGLVFATLIGVGLIHYAKLKTEEEVESITREVEQQIEENIDDAISSISTGNQMVDEEIYFNEEDIEEVEEETSENLSEIEILLKEMQADLEKHEQDPVYTFEEEQEEKAVISYQELKAMKTEPQLSDEVTNYEEEQERMAMETPDVETTLKKVEEMKEELPKEKTTFSNSEFISPVYGRMKNPEPNYPKIPNFKEEFRIQHDDEELQFDDVKVNLKSENIRSLEDAFDLEPISEEAKNNEEFLKALKDFRNNLE